MRTEQEEVIHELRKINAQLNPLPAFIKLGLWLFLFLCLLGIPGVVYQIGLHQWEKEHQPLTHQIMAHHPH